MLPYRQLDFCTRTARQIEAGILEVEASRKRKKSICTLQARAARTQRRLPSSSRTFCRTLTRFRRLCIHSRRSLISASIGRECLLLSKIDFRPHDLLLKLTEVVSTDNLVSCGDCIADSKTSNDR